MVTGDFPWYTAGILYRNGPGARSVKRREDQAEYNLSHWCDAFAQLHRFEIVKTSEQATRVRYNSRLHVDSLLESISRTGELRGFTFAQKRDPCTSLFRKVMTLFEPVLFKANFTNVSITVSANAVGIPEQLGHRATGMKPLIARTDENALKTLDPETLEPIGIAYQATLHPALTGPMSAGHAKSDPLTGDVFNFNLAVGYKTVYRVFKTSAETGKTEILATISDVTIPAAYLHSFFLTEDYVVLGIWGSHLAAGGLKVLWERNIVDALAPFDPTTPSKWLVVDRRQGNGLVATFESPAMFSFHAINAWQECSSDVETNIICDMIAYDSLDVLRKLYYENIRSSDQRAVAFSQKDRASWLPHFARFRLPGVTNRPQQAGAPTRPAERIVRMDSPSVGEVPTLNLRYATKPNRYFYSVVDRGHSTFYDGIAKVDTRAETSLLWDNPRGHTPGEAVFVPDPAGVEEDDGVLLSIVLDGVGGTSYLVCLDARTMVEIARADCRGPVCFSFHGQHVRIGKDAERPVDF